MLRLTQTVLDVGDCNVTLRYLGDGAGDVPLPFSKAESYNDLYQTVAGDSPLYSEVRGRTGTILRELRGAFAPNKFWQRYLGSRDEESYPQSAWEDLVPIAATLPEVEVILPPGLDLKVSPVPLVLLYPFGWSTWISYRIVGDYSLEELALLATHLVEKPAYHIDYDHGITLTLRQLFDRVGKGVREDAYGGKVFNPQDVLSVTTVIAKNGSSPSRGALTAGQPEALKRIIRSEGPEPAKSLTVPLRKGEDELLDYVLHDGLSWFLWVEDRLRPFGRNAQRLRCYHNNTFRSLLHTWMLQVFLAQALRIKPWSAALTDLVGRALPILTAPTYKNFCMLSFLDRTDFQTSRAAAEKRL